MLWRVLKIGLWDNSFSLCSCLLNTLLPISVHRDGMQPRTELMLARLTPLKLQNCELNKDLFPYKLPVSGIF
jgi:hypothetical protein